MRRIESLSALVLLLFAAGRCASSNHLEVVPAQFFYDDRTMSRARVDEGGCVIRSWDGTDSYGYSGPPWVSTIDCSASARGFSTQGVAGRGSVMLYLRHGSVMIDGSEELADMGDSYWIGDGAVLNLTARSATYVYAVGGEFILNSSLAESQVSSSFGAKRRRVYKSDFAVAGLYGDSANVQDSHIGNGTTNSRDLVFSRGASRVEPPSITVMNCAWDDDPATSYVWYHLHPAGAVYIPHTGRICFQTDTERCAEPGKPRWVAPNLFYYETFRPRLELREPSNEAARSLVDRAFERPCANPIVFSVSNFDPDDAVGQPNFDDAPNGKGTWGLWDVMTVRPTTIATVTTHAVLDDDAGWRPHPAARSPGPPGD